MKLVQFSIEKFRSLIDKSTVKIFNNTVIIGPNNEGKTNLLRALVISLNFLEDIANGRHMSSRNKNELIYSVKDVFIQRRNYSTRMLDNDEQSSTYSWERDYPISLKKTNGKKQNKVSTFILYFQLTEKENKEFRSKIKSSFKSRTIPIKLTMGSESIKLSIHSSGSFSKNISENKIKDIAYYITKKINICYIDAVRTASVASNSINRLLESEMREVYRSKEYIDAENKLNNFFAPSIDKLSKTLNENLRLFIPSIQEISLEFFQANRHLHDLNVLINDGNKTPISQKGSGVQSLIALSLAQNISLNKSHAESFILAIEEPEAHLHPKAIHEIKRVLFDISKRNQLIITTHSPLLANTNDLKSNIIVTNNIAENAQSIKEIRDTLGTIASDNLMFADNNILVEGLSDERILKTVLSALSPRINIAFNTGILKIINCDSCSKISAFISLMKVYISKYYVILDGDRDGVEEKRRIEKKDPSISGCITSFLALGMQESEIEDYVDPDSYIDRLATTFSLNNIPTLKKALNDINKKWSDRLFDYGAMNGHHFEDEDILKAKTIVADAVVEKGISALRTCRRDIFDTLAANIKKMLDD